MEKFVFLLQPPLFSEEAGEPRDDSSCHVPKLFYILPKLRDKGALQEWKKEKSPWSSGARFDALVAKLREGRE